VYVPTLCYLKDHPALGTCRACVVNVDGRVVPACTVTVSDRMRVEVNEPETTDMRQALVETLFAEGNHNCPSCEKSGRSQRCRGDVGLCLVEAFDGACGDIAKGNGLCRWPSCWPRMSRCGLAKRWPSHRRRHRTRCRAAPTVPAPRHDRVPAGRCTAGHGCHRCGCNGCRPCLNPGPLPAAGVRWPAWPGCRPAVHPARCGILRGFAVRHWAIDAYR
jgi:2Fe-2S iron-sulfur cluster binding domain/NADH-ubiquinone oxidoreductase-G iron-sulfur binding region